MSRIFLVRHGESEGNVNSDIYETVMDHDIKLTSKGKMQAIDLGKKIHKICKERDLFVFVSPYRRTRETWDSIRLGLNRNNLELEIDPRIREQEHKIFKNAQDRLNIFKERDSFGKFWYRFKNGESGCDVYSRIRTFLTELRLDRKIFRKKGDVVIVAHEIALRCILMRFLNLDVESFDRMPEIENCQLIILNTENFREATLDKSLNNPDFLKFFES